MSVFFCDTNSELWYTRADELGIKVIGMPYNIDDDEEKDYDLGRNTNFDEFYNRIKSGSVAKTSALNVQNYIDYFEPILAEGEDILYVHFSHNMSGTFEYMKQAIEILKEKYPNQKIKYVDTMRISIGEALLVYEAAKMWKKGISDEEIIEYIEKNRLNQKIYFLVDDLGHLRRGGRLSSTSCFFGTMLNIKPILQMDDEGKIVKLCVAKGRKKGISDLFEMSKNANIQFPICITHAQAEEDAKELKALIENHFNENKPEIWLQPIGPTVGTHCGPGTLGVSFREK